jgi:large subunit ribosomal protein L4
MQLPVYKRDGSPLSETVEIPDDLLAGEPNDHAMWLCVRSEEAAMHQGTHSTKIRKYVRGGGRKPFRQKGRGMARQGTIRSPLNPGGGTVFGPQPHDYVVKVTSKVKTLARRSAFILKARAGGIRIVEDFSMDAPRTRDVVAMLAALGLAGEKVLLLTPEFNLTIAKSFRNLPRAASQKAEVVSTKDLLNCTTLLFQKSALPKLIKVLGHAA